MAITTSSSSRVKAGRRRTFLTALFRSDMSFLLFQRFPGASCRPEPLASRSRTRFWKSSRFRSGSRAGSVRSRRILSKAETAQQRRTCTACPAGSGPPGSPGSVEASARQPRQVVQRPRAPRPAECRQGRPQPRRPGRRGQERAVQVDEDGADGDGLAGRPAASAVRPIRARAAPRQARSRAWSRSSDLSGTTGISRRRNRSELMLPGWSGSGSCCSSTAAAAHSCSVRMAFSRAGSAASTQSSASFGRPASNNRPARTTADPAASP